jgi:TonB family protein
VPETLHLRAAGIVRPIRTCLPKDTMHNLTRRFAGPAQAASALWLLVAGSALVQAAAPQYVTTASPAVRYSPADHCTNLRISDDGTFAIVLFQVSPSGAPSKASVRLSSGSPDLDAAALDCVMKLKYHPATRVGEGTPVESWQQMSLRWVTAPGAPAATAAPVALTAPAAGTAMAPAAAAAATGAAVATVPAAVTHASAGTTDVRACGDVAGQLTQDPAVVRSSGDAAQDAAAVKIARAASGSYPASGCVRLTVRPDSP